MERSRLVHRLEAPRGGMENPYTFGVGLVHGGFNDEAMEQMRGVFEFGHMGAAEYEFGRPQEAMADLWEDKDKLVSFEMKVGTKGPEGLKEEGSVYIICRNDDKIEVSKRVKAWARYGGHSLRYLTRDSVRLDYALRQAASGMLEDYSTRGWLELDNGFFFTVDAQMAKGFEGLLGMTLEVENTGVWV
jgi:hypothetical protein